MALYPVLRPLAFMLEAETAHHLTVKALGMLPPGLAESRDPILAVDLAGLNFPNPVGLAAGFDKDARIFAQMLGFGFGSVEVGTVTPRPQAGNAKPRLFRLTEDRAVINRMGFNSGGQEAAFLRLQRRRRGSGIVGVNIGANRDSDDRIADYVAGARKMAPVADYLTINISSPNTPGLRALQDKSALTDLLEQLNAERGPPLFLKVAPDLEPRDIDDIAKVAIDNRVDALMIGNTTISRPSLTSRHRGEAGGLSGAPLKMLALERLRDFRRAAGPALPLVAVGGIENGVDALARIRAGASLIQFYSALVYEGPGLAARISSELKRLLLLEGYASLTEAIGADSSR